MALEKEARRVRMSELAMLSAILGTQERTGGNLSEAVGNLAEHAARAARQPRPDQGLDGRVRVTLAILAAVPVLALGIQAAMQPELLDVLLGEARHLLGIGVGLIVGGLVVSWLMIRGAQR